MKVEFEPCPFCGEKESFDVQFGTVDREGTPTAITCCECGAVGPWVYVKDTLFSERARKLWNERK